MQINIFLAHTKIIYLSRTITAAVMTVLSLTLMIKVSVTSSVIIMSCPAVISVYAWSWRRSYNNSWWRWSVTIAISITAIISIVVTRTVVSSICTGRNADCCNEHSDYC